MYRILSIKHRGRFFQTRVCRPGVYENPALLSFLMGLLFLALISLSLLKI